MPIYAYQCDNGHRFDELQRVSDDPVTACVCGATAQRKLSPPAVHFKGPGFHNTDYASGRRPKGATR